MPLGVLAAQLVHAAGESGPVAHGTHAIVLEVNNLIHLQNIEYQLQMFNIKHHAIREPDSPWNGELMAIGIEPISDRKLINQVTRKLHLLGGNND